MNMRVMNDFIGNGLKITYFGKIIVSGNDLIPNTFQLYQKVIFPNLNFEVEGGNLFEFDENTGEITFLRSGIMHIIATLNIDTALGTAKVEISTQRNKGLGWNYLDARVAELPVIGQRQTILAGTIDDNEKGHKIRFELCGPSGNPTFKTQTLANSSIVFATIIDIFQFTL